MEDSLQSGGILQRNKKLETFLLVIGFGLFVFFGMRGLQTINNKAVAAGDAYKSAVIQSSDSQYEQFSQAVLVESADLKTQPVIDAQHTDDAKGANRDKNDRQDADRQSVTPGRVVSKAAKAKSQAE